MSFLPDNYEKPASNSRYFKFQAGDNKFRILSPAIVGYIDWDNKKPIRTVERPKQSIDPEKPYKHFWTFVVWDYQDKAIKILEVTQATIQDAIFTLQADENWGDPKEYDINVVKTGDKLETKYSILPVPPKPVHPKILELLADTPINLQELYSGGDPFNSGKEIIAALDRAVAEGHGEINVDDIPF